MRRVVMAAVVVLAGCKVQEPVQVDKVVDLEEIEVTVSQGRPVYNPEYTKYFDLIHTQLDVEFDWTSRQLNGTAELTLSPHFYPANHVTIDAKGMELHKVGELDTTGTFVAREFVYDDQKVFVQLDRKVTREDTVRLFFDYTAKPEEIQVKGSRAITSDKGLYFINHDGSDPHKPKQIWTQGETEASSCWFPTLDSPNQKTTQNVKITVDNKYQTLSNGTLLSQIEKADGKRTDQWEQDEPHAPYLMVMVIGEFAVVKDTWRDSIQVHYYVEPDYEEDARAIFGNTPEMMELYSTLLGVDYPWDKYHQVVVRDYVSGAMENTSAVIHGEFVQRTKRQLLDKDFEFIVAHELFHHWFGDLVTCESWANLPLNESFATYGEYLWAEHKYGPDQAEYDLRGFKGDYFREAKNKQVHMIRFDYEQREDMFDNHSYEKGGAILHMLRNYLGDEAFFLGLKKYLDDHRFGTAEMHDLRLAMEAVSGQDLNWFFDQWFFASGHPMLTVTYDYDQTTKEQIVAIEQTQDLDNCPIYKLPIDIDVYTSNGVLAETFTLERTIDTFRIHAPDTVRWVNVDPDHVLLAKYDDQKPDHWWPLQFAEGKRFGDRQEAMRWAVRNSDADGAMDIIRASLDDRFWSLRIFGTLEAELLAKEDSTLTYTKLVEMAAGDDNANVRKMALKALDENFGHDSTLYVFERSLTDQSYGVVSQAISAIISYDRTKGEALAKQFKDTESEKILNAFAAMYADSAADSSASFFTKNLHRTKRGARSTFIKNYKKFLIQDHRDIEVFQEGVKVVQQAVEEGGYFWAQVNAAKALIEMEKRAGKWAQEQTVGENPQPTDRALEAANVEKALGEIIADIRADEKHKKLVKYLD